MGSLNWEEFHDRLGGSQFFDALRKDEAYERLAAIIGPDGSPTLLARISRTANMLFTVRSLRRRRRVYRILGPHTY